MNCLRQIQGVSKHEKFRNKAIMQETMETIIDKVCRRRLAWVQSGDCFCCSTVVIVTSSTNVYSRSCILLMAGSGRFFLQTPADARITGSVRPSGGKSFPMCRPDKSTSATVTAELNPNFVHRNHRYACPVCFKTIARSSDLEGHMSTWHNMPKKYKCLECNKEYAYRKKLKVHVLNKHGHSIAQRCASRSIRVEVVRALCEQLNEGEDTAIGDFVMVIMG